MMYQAGGKAGERIRFLFTLRKMENVAAVDGWPGRTVLCDVCFFFAVAFSRFFAFDSTWAVEGGMGGEPDDGRKVKARRERNCNRLRRLHHRRRRCRRRCASFQRCAKNRFQSSSVLHVAVGWRFGESMSLRKS